MVARSAQSFRIAKKREEERAADAPSKTRDSSRRIDREVLPFLSFSCAFGLIQKHQKIKHGEK